MEELFVLTKKIVFEKDDFFEGGILPFAVLRAFQDVAVLHAEKLGVGFDAMLKKNLFWVLLRTKYEILRQPLEGEELEIETYPSGKNMFEFDRDFLIFDKQKNLVLKGTSKWCFIDAKTRRLAKMEAFEDVDLQNFAPVFEGRFLRNDLFVPQKLPDDFYEISSADIDGNNHTNNTVYAKMIENILKRHHKKIGFFQINFLKESLLGDKIDLFEKCEEDTFDVLGKICEGETTFLCHAKFE